jgi:hypothetical protein
MQKLFDLFMSSSDLSQQELALIELSIGQLYWDKLRGHPEPARLYEHYKASGGSDPVTESIFNQIDDTWSDANISSHPLSPPGLDIQKGHQELSAAERTLIQRAIGRGMLNKMRGIETNLSEIYRELGGTDSYAQEAFAYVDQHWHKFNPQRALEAIATR